MLSVWSAICTHGWHWDDKTIWQQQCSCTYVTKVAVPNRCISDYTGGKGWWPGLIHHKSITRTWVKYQAKTHLVHPKSIQNIPRQFPCSVPGSGNGWYIHSVPDHVTRVFPSGTSWEHSKFSYRKYPEFSWVAHSEFPLQFPQQWDCSVPGSGNGQYICSFPGHVTREFPSGTPWEHLKFSHRKYSENTRVAHLEFPLWCSQQCDHSVPSQ